MKQSLLIKIIDVCSFVSLVLIISTGTLLEFTLPARSGPATVVDMTRHEWGSLHFYMSVVFLGMMSLHLFTHAKYIKQLFSGTASTTYKYRIGVGLVGLIALIATLLAPFLAPVNDREGGGFGSNGYGHGAKFRRFSEN